uniref:YfhO family protein n=1 Tax=Eubacterium sp. TaxID=142586 RepID=UPI0040277E71
MDITVNTKKRFANSFMNGETVNYVISFVFSFLFLIAVKQFFKTFVGLSANISAGIGFAFAEIVLFLLEKFFVYKGNALNNTIKQIIFTVGNTAVHLGIFAALSTAIKFIQKESYTAWFTAFIFIMIINYPISRVLVFDCYSPAKTFVNGRVYKFFFRNRFVFLSMATALLLMLFVLFIFSAFPFGDVTVLRMDLYHQYGPLFVELYDRVTGAESFLYSWTSGGGSSFLGNFFNYLSSPFSALIFLFDRDEMPFAITTIVSLKCIFSAGTFTFYLKKSLNRHSTVSATFGVLYAFCAYFLAYYWNVMWLDGMIALPLLVLGIEKLVDNGKGWLYVCSLVYIIYCNYYIGYMSCIFSVIYLIAYLIISEKRKQYLDPDAIYTNKYSLKKFFNYTIVDRLVKFAAYSLICGLICAFFLLPIYFILSGSSATSDSTPDGVEKYFSLFDFIETHFAGLETTIRSSGSDILPNVYCSVLTIILLPLYMVNKNIRLKEKGVFAALVAIFLLSFNNNYVNFFWHGLHFPNDLPYRFSYMYSFILLVIAFRGLMKIRSISVKEIAFVGILWIAVIAVADELPTQKMDSSTIYITLAFVLIYTAVLLLLKKRNFSKFIASALILAVAFCEVVIADPNALNFNQSLSNYNENYDVYTDAVSYLEENDKSDYRTELCSLKTRMDTCLYGYDGMSIFSSMAYEEYSGLQYSLGMYGNRINSYTYNTQTPVYNMMYNIKYLIYNGEETRPSTDLYTKYYEISNNAVIYENDYFLPKAFCVNEALDAWNTAEGNPFQVQADFFALATGFSGVFTEAEYESTSYTGMSGEQITQGGTYWVEKTDSNSYAETNISLKAARDGNLYIYASASDIANISVITDEESKSFSIETPYIIDLGYFTEGQSVTISLDCASLPTGEKSIEFFAYSINKDVLQAGYEKLRKEAMETETVTDRYISGTVYAESNRILYTSIPYDSGWSVYVDGTKTETFKIGDSQLGVMLKPGQHEIEFKYTPKGLYLGAGVSGVTLISLAAVTALKLRKRKNNKLVKS